METRKIKTRTELVVYVLIILGIIAVVNYLGVKWFSRIDLTEGRQYTVSPATKRIVSKLDDIINVKVYCSKDLKQEPRLQSTLTQIKDMLSEYKAYGGKNLRISWIDPSESDAARQEARNMGINEIQAQVVERDKIQVVSGYLGLAVLFADRKELMPLGANVGNFEYDLTRAILKVSRPTMPKIGVLRVDTLPDIPPEIMARMGREQQQNPEKTDVKYASLIEKLKENYDVVLVDVWKGKPVDSSLRALIVPGSAPISDRAAFEIDQYFMKGGKLIVFAGGMKVEMNQYMGPMAMNADSKILDLVQSYGVKVDQDMVLDASCNPVQMPQRFGQMTAYVAMPYPYFVKIGRDGFDRANPAVAPLSEAILPWTSSLTLTADQSQGVKSTILAKSSPKSWILSGQVDLNPQQNWDASLAKTKFTQSTLAAYLTGSFKSYYAGKSIPPVNQQPPVGDTLSKINLQSNPDDAGRSIVNANPQGHLVVVGNSDFVAAQNAAPQNLLLAVNIVDWLSQDENLISIRSRMAKDRTIDADQLKKSSSMPTIVRAVNVVLMPILVIIIGILIFVRRREHVAAQPSAPAAAPAEPETLTGDKSDEL